MKLSWVPFKPQIGLLKQTLCPKQLVAPILQGKLRGTKWIVSSSNLECVLGSYENTMVNVFGKTVQNGWVVYDVGAHVGFYTLLASKLVGENGNVFAFEPFPLNILSLNKHVAINRCLNVKVVAVAVSDRNGKQLFDTSFGASMGRLSIKGDLMVHTTTIDMFAYENKSPTCIKIDVEGHEQQVLNGAEKTLRTCHPTLFLATHGIDNYNGCVKYLRKLDYTIQDVSSIKRHDRKELFCYFRNSLHK